MNLDKTSLFGAIACALIFLGLSLYIESNYRTPEPEPAPETAAPSTPTPPPPPGAPAAPGEGATTAAAATATASIPAPGAESTDKKTPSLTPAPAEPMEAARDALQPAQEVKLENELLTVVLTTHGGAIQYVDLKKHPAEGDQDVRLNTGSTEPVFNLFGWNGDTLLADYELVSHTSNEVVFRRRFGNGLELGLELIRHYTLSGDYQVLLSQQVRNTGSAKAKLANFRLNLGTEGPIHQKDVDRLIGASWLTGDGTFQKISVLSFLAGGFLGIEWSAARDNITSEPEDAPIQWAACNNQFYVLLLTPPVDEGILRVDVQPRVLPQWAKFGDTVAKATQTEAWLPGFELEPGAERTSLYNLYAGPKDYDILSRLDRRQSLLMDFGWFGWIIVPLLSAMNLIHAWLFAGLAWGWGWTIILLTVLIKSVLWPLQSVANRNMKQMQQLHPKIEELRNKHKDNPQKMNEEVFKLYKDYGINPAGGCLPLLVQMPIFIGFYIMLQSAVELRGQSFLWIHDLTQPDTVYRLPTESFLGYDFPINPLPILMTATTVLLMQMNPAASDNPQMKMFKWLPVVFLVVLYNFAAALPLYWTVNNLIQGVQTYLNLRRPAPELKKKKTAG